MVSWAKAANWGFSGSIDWVELKPTRKGTASFLDATFVIDG
jgi:hypothetical protein